MSKYIYIYRGPANEMTEEQGAAWGAWMAKLGSSMVDMGSPFGKRAVIVDDGSSAKPSDSSGYTIVEAADLAAATALTKGNPLLSENKGLHSIEILELVQM